MPRMNGSAAGAASYNAARVVDMEELKRARQNRASSERRPFAMPEEQEQAGARERSPKPGSAARQTEAPAFWQQEDPFGERGRRQRREEPAQGEEQEDRLDRQYDWRSRRGAEPRRQAREVERAPQPAREEGRRQGFARQEPRVQEERADLVRGRQAARGRKPSPQQEEETGGKQWEFEFRPKPAQAQRYEPDEVYRPAPRSGRRQGSYAAESAREQGAPLGRKGYHLLLLLLGLIVIGVLIGFKMFEIKSIDVQGNSTITGQSIAALSGIAAGENIFKADLSLAKKNIESNPLLVVVGISRVLPDKIEIKVKQRTPHGAISYLSGYVIIDENGTVLDIRDSLPAGQYPLISGIEIRPSEKGKKVVGLDAGVQKTMYDIMTALYDNKAIQYVSTVNLEKPDNITMFTAEGIKIEIGTPTDLAKKAQWIACTVPALRSHGYTAGTLFVTGANNPVFSGTGSADAGKDSDSAKGNQNSGNSGGNA